MKVTKYRIDLREWERINAEFPAEVRQQAPEGWLAHKLFDFVRSNPTYRDEAGLLLAQHEAAQQPPLVLSLA